MAANIEEAETSLLTWAVAWLNERLPEGWKAELEGQGGAFGPDPARVDGLILLRTPTSSVASIAVEARSSLTPKEVEGLLPRLGEVLRSMSGDAPILIVAPWLSGRTQALLSERGIGYMDRTGNAEIKLRNPAVYIKTVGAARNPRPRERGKAQLRGPKAGRLLRTLIDVRPPYGVTELAVATGLAPGYVSRMVNALDEDALVRRRPRGAIEAVDIPAILRRWAASYDVFKSNRLSSFIAPAGTGEALAAMAESSGDAQAAITGSFAANRLAPVAAPTMLLAYSSEPKRLARELQLLPADEGANIGLLWPFDPVVWTGTREVEGLRFAAPSQVAVDCLTGNGRMPAEGEAVLEWMATNEESWRSTELESEGKWPT